MKKRFTLVLSLLVIGGMALDMTNRTAHGNSSGAPAGNSGSPSDGNTCARSGCHTGGPAQTNQVVSISSNIPVGGYVSGETYEMTATMSNGGVKFGFSLSPQDAQGNLLGTLVANSTTAINGSGKYLTHTSSSNSGSGSKSWTFGWIAPAVGTGSVTFYGAFNFANNAMGSQGDVIVAHSQSFSENISIGISEQQLEAISIYPNPAEDAINIRLSDVDEVITVQMFSMDGRQLFSEQFNSGNIVIDLASRKVSSGLYVVQVEAGSSKVTRKVVVH